MTRPGIASIVVLLAVAGCGGKKPAPRPAAPPTARAVSAPVAEAKRDAAIQEWSYTSVGKRDPFRSFVADLAAANAQSVVSRCATPLGRFDLDQLKVVAVVTGLEDPVAMVEGPNGIGYTVRRGTCIGRNGGVVSSVRSGDVVVGEWLVRADGTRERTQVLLSLPKEPSLNIEE